MYGLWEELKRRFIYRVAAAYAVAAWAILQLFNNLSPILKAPDWTGTLILVLLIGGFPAALIFAWLVEHRAPHLVTAPALAQAGGPAKLPAGPQYATADGSSIQQFAGSTATTSAMHAPHAPVPHVTSTVTGPDGPSLVVLPFANMSGDPQQDVLADGLTEDILTELSRFRHLFIISRNTAFRYKGIAVDVRQVARELGVQYVLEGSVRRSGNRIRVTVQLIEGQSDRHIWAERYDRDLEDIFALQDEVAATIVATLPGRVDAAAGERADRKPTENMTAYECVLAGKQLHHRSNRDDNAKALQLLERAIALDPNYAHAHAWKACVIGQAWSNGYRTDIDTLMAESWSEVQTALRLDPNDSDVHRILAAINLTLNQHEKATYHQERALCLNPNDDLIVVQQGEFLTWLGRPEEGIPWIEKAMRLNPYHPERYWNHLGRAYFAARRYADAISAFSRIARPNPMHHAYLAGSYAMLGDGAAAQRRVDAALKDDPTFSVQSFLQSLHFLRPEDTEHCRAALLMAGLPSSGTPAAANATPADNLSCS